VNERPRCELRLAPFSGRSSNLHPDAQACGIRCHQRAHVRETLSPQLPISDREAALIAGSARSPEKPDEHRMASLGLDLASSPTALKTAGLASTTVLVGSESTLCPAPQESNRVLAGHRLRRFASVGELSSWLSQRPNLAGMDGNRTHPGRLNSAPQTVLKTVGLLCATVHQRPLTFGRRGRQSVVVRLRPQSSLGLAVFLAVGAPTTSSGPAGKDLVQGPNSPLATLTKSGPVDCGRTGVKV
jgi:hypothetical protein